MVTQTVPTETMATESDLRREIADERRKLTDAVSSLRTELGHAVERAKKAGTTAGALTGAALAARTLLRLRRRGKR
jgi:hypothetical protein